MEKYHFIITQHIILYKYQDQVYLMGSQCLQCVELCQTSNDTILNIITQKLLSDSHLQNYKQMLLSVVQGWLSWSQNIHYFCFNFSIPQIKTKTQIQKDKKYNGKFKAIIYSKNLFLYIGEIEKLQPQGKGILYSVAQICQDITLRQYQGTFLKGVAEDTQAKFVIYNSQIPVYSPQFAQITLKDSIFEKGIIKKCRMHIKNEIYQLKINQINFTKQVQKINIRIVFPDNQTIYEGDIIKTKNYLFKIQGKGQLIYPNKNYYIGSFKNNKFQGEGEFYFVGGKKYHGFYKNGLKHGKGKFYAKAKSHPNNYLQAIWQYGSPQGKAISYPSKTCIIFQKGKSIFSSINQTK